MRNKHLSIPLEAKMATMSYEISEEKVKDVFIHSNCEGRI
jgi:hypothetical protein